MKKLLLTLLCVAPLAACGGEDVHAVDYYLHHKDERKAQIDRCNANPGELRNSPNCVNAFQAQAQANSEEMRAILQQ